MSRNLLERFAACHAEAGAKAGAEWENTPPAD